MFRTLLVEEHLRSARVGVVSVIYGVSSGCAYSPIPGVAAFSANVVNNKPPLGISLVIAAIKCEAAKAMVRIQKNYKKRDIRYRSLILYPGTATVSVNTKVVNTGTGKMQAIVPFQIKNTHTPTGELGATDTGTREVKVTFEVDSFAEDADICQDDLLHAVDTGGFISDALVTLHDEIAKVPTRGSEVKLSKTGQKEVVNRPYDPAFMAKTLEITATFAVDVKGQIGASLKYVTLLDLGPSLVTSNQAVGVNSVVMNFPLKPGQTPPESRNIIECVHGTGTTRCLQRPPEPGELEPVRTN